MKLAPIVLFVYNRPWHTKQCILSLQKNILAKQSELFIFSDGPRDKEDQKDVQEVRNYIRTIRGFMKVTIRERKKNYGLADSVIDGVTEIVNTYGKIIVLEDDLTTSIYFLEFMNEALNNYKDEDKVISIHGYIYPVTGRLPETFFLKDTGCWGWATWKRGWKLFEEDGISLLNELRAGGLTKDFDFTNSFPFTEMLEKQTKGRIDSWAIRWQAAAFLKDKLTLYPGRSLVSHVGTDGSGTNNPRTSSFDVNISNKKIPIRQITLEENQSARNEYIKYFRSIMSPKRRMLYHFLSLRDYFDWDIFRFIKTLKLVFLPRSQPGVIKLSGYVIHYCDSLSTLHEYQYIFNQHIYSFKSTNPSPVIIDAGGYIGLSTLFFKSIYPNARVTVFEPDAHIYGVLKRNIRENRLKNVNALNVALGKKDGTSTFFTDNADGGSLYSLQEAHQNKKIVKIVKLSTFITQPIDCIKLNVEGAEGDVFEEIEDKLYLVKHIICEYHVFSNLPQKLDRILQILNKHHFRYLITTVTNKKIPLPFQLPKHYRYYNLIYAERV